MEKEGFEDFFDSEYEKIYRQLIRLSESASIDELTQLLNRRAGKMKLEQYIEKARSCNQTLAVCLYDINELKSVNDTYGHKEGDRLLEYTSFVVKEVLSRIDFAFRLSGDEFVIVFYGKTKEEAEVQIQNILKALEEKKEESGLYYKVSFSYGITECLPEQDATVKELLAQADNLMYLQKRDYHIAQNIEKEKKKLAAGITPEAFDYDKEQLYEALLAGTDDDIFVGNLKTGVFRYPKHLAEEFGLPGEVVENAAVVWSHIVHKDDIQAFMESNQEIADGRTDYHDIQYRAQNMQGEWIWLRCRGKMLRDENGVPALFAGMITNLGTRKQRSCTKKQTREIPTEVQERLCNSVKDGFSGFSARYRPRFAPNGKVCGAEIACVWNDREYGILGPDDFIPILDKDGTLPSMRAWVFENAMRQCKKWSQKLPYFQMCVNFSCMQCMDGENIAFMNRMMEKYALPPQNVLVELRQEVSSRHAVDVETFENKYLKDI